MTVPDGQEPHRYVAPEREGEGVVERVSCRGPRLSLAACSGGRTRPEVVAARVLASIR